MSNPFIFGGPVPPNDFFGRRESIEFMMDRLYGHSRSSIALWGDRRVGKSSLLHYLVQPKVRHQWVDNPGQNYILFLDCQIFTSFDRQAFWQEVLEQVSDLVTDTSLPQQAAQLLNDGDLSERVLRRFLRQMQRSGETITLLLDEFGHLIWLASGEARQEVQALLAFLRTLITAVNPASTHLRPLALVTSTRRPLNEVCQPIHGSADAGSPFHNPFVFERLKPFEIEDVHMLLASRLANLTIQFSEREIDQLLAQAGRHPILVQSYASELFTAKLALGRDLEDFAEIDEQFASRNRQHFQDFWSYSSQPEKALMGRLVKTEVDWSGLPPNLEHARQQLGERGLLTAENQLFSPIFARWLHLNLSQLEQEPAAEPPQLQVSRLLPAIDFHFNEGELREFCFELGVDYDNLPGDGKRDKARELCDWMRRYGRLEELVDLLLEKRPNLRLS